MPNSQTDSTERLEKTLKPISAYYYDYYLVLYGLLHFLHYPLVF